MKRLDVLLPFARSVPRRMRGGRHRGSPSGMKPLVYPSPPERPVGVKLEITHRCNLLCSFCYTDSPAKTLTKTHDLGADVWLDIVDQAIGLGVIEAVVSGGEPLLRKQLTLDIMSRFDAAGVASILTTNGWFLDDEAASVIAGLRHAKVGISLDGLTPELHDAARGVPGSWERAVAGVNRLLARGAHVRVNHVVTPLNQAYVTDFLDAFWDFGIRKMRIAPASVTGGATRGGEWSVDVPALQRNVAEFRSRHGGARQISLRQPEEIENVDRGGAPSVLLVRPDGGVVIDSQRPLHFGDVRADGMAAIWANVHASWAQGEFPKLAAKMRSHVAYREADLVIAGARVTSKPAAAEIVGLRSIPLGVPAAIVGGGDRPRAVAHLEALTAGRRLRVATHRWAGDQYGLRMVRTADGTKHVISSHHGLVMDAFAEARTITEGLAVHRRLTASSPDGAPVLPDASVRAIITSLRERRLLVAASTG